MRAPLRRDAIVARAVEIVDESGLDGLSLRSLAADLGVSAPALYDHLSSKDELLRAVAAVGYEALAVDVPRDDEEPLAALRRGSHAYVELARTRPGLFSAMFLYRPAGVAGPAAVEHIAATELFESGMRTVRRAVDAGVLHGDAAELSLGLWAATHGVATVAALGAVDGAAAARLVDVVIGGLLDGWAVQRSSP